MLCINLFSKSSRFTPLLMTRRWKVRIFPRIKEHYGDDETMFMGKPQPRKKWFVDVFSVMHRKNWTFEQLNNWFKWKVIIEMKDDQRYMPERQKALGPELAVTHFLTARGGKVKFVGNDKWITIDDVNNSKVPSFYVPGFFIEEIDASGTNLCYEGFDNFCNLTKLKKLNLSKCPFIDDWCLGRSHLFADSLEFLDLSGCELVTERGICALHTLKRLKTLVINDTPNIQNKELVSLLLQDVIPSCNIIGVNFSDPILLKRIENYIH